jgi:hypothetical protein
MRTALAAFALTSLACATAAPSVQTVSGSEVHVVGQPIGPDGLDTYDAETLFQRAIDFLEGQQWADCAQYFERFLREFPDDKRVVVVHYNLAVAYIHLERGDEAVREIDKYLAMLPASGADRDRLDGRFKRAQALAVAQRYDELVELCDNGLLTEEVGLGFSVEDRIEALVDAGVGHYMLGLHDPDGPHRPTAESRFLEARRLYRTASEKARLDVGYFTAQAAFYLAELARLEFSEYKLKFPSTKDIAKAEEDGAKHDPKGEKPSNVLEKLLGDQLEEKCQKLLRAQYAYLRTIREGHPSWASAAGYNVGQMYEELHDELINLPAPPDLGPDAATLYQKMVRKKVLILLAKAEKTWSSNSDMVTRTGAESEWAEKTRASLQRIKQKLMEETAATADVDDASKSDVANKAKAKDAS